MPESFIFWAGSDYNIVFFLAGPDWLSFIGFELCRTGLKKFKLKTSSNLYAQTLYFFGLYRVGPFYELCIQGKGGMEPAH